MPSTNGWVLFCSNPPPDREAEARNYFGPLTFVTFDDACRYETEEQARKIAEILWNLWGLNFMVMGS